MAGTSQLAQLFDPQLRGSEEPWQGYRLIELEELELELGLELGLELELELELELGLELELELELGLELGLELELGLGLGLELAQPQRPQRRSFCLSHQQQEP